MKPPFFVIGVQRSGTTMLRLMLNRHSRICVPHESVFINNYYWRLDEYSPLHLESNRRRLVSDIAAEPMMKKSGIVSDVDSILARGSTSYGEIVRDIFDEHAGRKGKSRWGDKTPSYTRDIDLLHSLFPDAFFIHLVRDGRAVAASQLKTSWAPNNIPTIARHWSATTTIAHKVGRVLTGQYLELRYEDLVGDPERTMREVCDFLGENFEPTMLTEYAQSETDVPTSSLQWHRSSVRAPDVAKIDEWRTGMNASDVQIFEEIAGTVLADFNYALLGGPGNIKTKLRRLYYGVVKRW